MNKARADYASMIPLTAKRFNGTLKLMEVKEYIMHTRTWMDFVYIPRRLVETLLRGTALSVWRAFLDDFGHKVDFKEFEWVMEINSGILRIWHSGITW